LPRLLLWAAVSVVSGMLLPNAALAIWPIASLVVGVAFGTGMFGGEQAGDAYRFLGNQRLPASHLWLAKTIAWSAMAAAILVVMLLGTLVQVPLGSPGTSGRSGGVEHFLGSQLLAYVPKALFLLLWPVYGFAVGQLLSMICRKSAVALVLSLLMTVPLVGIWIPSLITGGLKLWQILPLPALLLLATRIGLWAWTADLLKSWRSVLGFLTCGSLAGVWLAGNLAYRAIEIPDLGEPFGVAAFVANIPKPENNRAGSLIHRAAQELLEEERLAEENGQRLSKLFEGIGERSIDPEQGEAGGSMPPWAGPDTPATQSGVEPLQSKMGISAQDAITLVIEKGWPDGDAELDAWLEELCHGEWIDHLRQAAALPLGVVEDPRLLRGSTRIAADTVYQRLAELLAARALQVQARGDHALALDHLLWALALSRNLRCQAVTAFYLQGQTVETIALTGLDRWLDRVGPQAILLRRALEALNRHEEETPPATESIQAEYLILRERLDDPARWLVTDYSSETAGLERDLITLALQTPWERERATRLLNALTNSRLKEARTPYWKLPPQALVWNRESFPADAIPADEARLVSFVPTRQRILPLLMEGDSPLSRGQWERLLADSRLLLRLFVLWPRPQPVSEAFSLCRVRGARLKLALALYRVHEGKPAATLDNLVPRYLEELPADPFSGQPFHYRGSTEERAERRRRAWEDDPAGMQIPAGRAGIVWSAGAEKGPGFDPRSVLGRQSYSRPIPSPSPWATASDRIFFVPSWSE
jgi:hypothetical protein